MAAGLEPAAEPPAETQPVDSELQPADSETQDNYQLGFSLGGDSEPVSDFPTFGASTRATDLGGLGFTLDYANNTESTPPANGATVPDPKVPVEPEMEFEADEAAPMSVESDQPPGKEGSAPMATESAQPLVVSDESTPALDGEDSFLAHVNGAAQTLGAEDSFLADAHGVAQTLSESPVRAQNPFADNEVPNTTWHNALWNTNASPEQPSRVSSPHPQDGSGMEHREDTTAAESSSQVCGPFSKCTRSAFVLITLL